MGSSFVSSASRLPPAEWRGGGGQKGNAGPEHAGGDRDIAKMREIHAKEYQQLAGELGGILDRTKDERIRIYCRARLELSKETVAVLDSALARKDDRQATDAALKVMHYSRMQGDFLNTSIAFLLEVEEDTLSSQDGNGTGTGQIITVRSDLNKSRKAIAEHLAPAILEMNTMLAHYKKASGMPPPVKSEIQVVPKAESPTGIQKAGDGTSLEGLRQEYAKFSEVLNRKIEMMLRTTKGERVAALCQARLDLAKEILALLDSAIARKDDKKATERALVEYRYLRMKGDLLNRADALVAELDRSPAGTESGQGNIKGSSASTDIELTKSRGLIADHLDAAVSEMDAFLALYRKTAVSK